jgi:hypothetical protein
MTSIIKVDDVQDAAGNNIIKEAADTITIGAAGDTVDVPGTEVKTNKVSPTSGTGLQLGDSGDTITIPSGATIANSGTATGFGGANTPYFARYNDTQAVANATETVLQFTGSIVDNGSDWDGTNYRWIPQSSGTYFVYAYIVFMSTANWDIAQVRIRKNGSTRIAECQMINGFYDTHYISAMVSLNGSSDYVDCTAYQEQGGSIDVANNTIYVSNFGGYKIIE